MSEKSFRQNKFFISRFLGSLSDQFLLFAVPLAILKSTGSVKYSALAFVIEWAPRVIFFPLGGFFADLIKPRYIFFGVELARSLVVAIAVILLLIHAASIFIILSIMMAFLSVGYVLNFVTTEAYLPRNLDAVDLPRAHSMLQGVDNVTQVIGPVFAVTISAFSGINSLLIFGAILFGASSLNLFSLKAKSVDSDQKFNLTAMINSHSIALKILGENKILLHLCALTWVVNLLYGAALVVSAAVVVKQFQLSESYFGFLQTIAAIISIGLFMFVPKFANKFGLSTLGLASFCAMIFSGFLLAISGRFEVYVLGYAGLMAFDGAFNVYIRTLRSQIIPKEHMGKTTGFIALLNMFSIPLSGLVVTILAAYFSPTGIIGFIFILALTLGLILILLGKKVFKYNTWLPSIYTVQQI
jgi:MFS family permease